MHLLWNWDSSLEIGVSSTKLCTSQTAPAEPPFYFETIYVSTSQTDFGYWVQWGVMQILTLVYLSPAVCRVDHSLSYHSNSNLSDLCLPIYCAVIRKWVGFTSRIFLQVLPTMCTDSLHWLSVSPSHPSTDSRAGRHSSQSGHYTLLLQLISHNTTTNVSKCLVSVEEEIEGSFILSASGLQCSVVHRLVCWRDCRDRRLQYCSDVQLTFLFRL